MSDDGTHGSDGTQSMSRKMEGYKRGGVERNREGEREKQGETERGNTGFPGTDADTPAREAVMRY